MSGVAINQTEATVYDEEIPEGVCITDVPSSSTKPKHLEQDDGGCDLSGEKPQSSDAGVSLLEPMGSPREAVPVASNTNVETEVQQRGSDRHDRRAHPINEVSSNERAPVAGFEKSIHHHRETLRHPASDADRSTALEHLGALLLYKFYRMGNMADLEESIHHFQEHLLCPIDHPRRSATLNNLGVALGDRFKHVGEMVDLGESINHHREALPLRPISHPGRSVTLENLGNSLSTRFELMGDILDLEESILHLQEALSLRPVDHPSRLVTLDSLGRSSSTRFEWMGDITDLEQSIRHYQEALTFCPVGDPKRSRALNNVGIALGYRFDRMGTMSDLEESIHYHQEAMSLCPVGHPGRSNALDNLSSALSARFEQMGDMANLEESINYQQESLSLCPIGHPDRSHALNSLGNRLSHRFDKMGDMADLEESIYHLQEALSLNPIGHPCRSETLINLGNVLNMRFNHTGDMADLEESIHHSREDLLLCSIGHRRRSVTLNNLGVALSDRFEQTSNMDDLEESIYHHQAALSLRPIPHPGRSTTLNNLSTQLSKRFDHTGETTDLERSIHYLQEALSLHPVGHPGRSQTLNNLGNRLSTRFDQMGNISDLEESIRHYQEALSLHPIGHPDRSLSLNNLGKGLSMRFDQTGNIADLENSIHHHQNALPLHPFGHPDRSSTLINLGYVLGTRFDQTGAITDLEQSIRYYMDAVDHKSSPSSIRLVSAHNWITEARKNSLESLQEAYTSYMDLLDRSLLLAASSIHDSHSHMIQVNSQGMDMTADATSHAIEKHQLTRAVEIAERGRALLFTQLGSYRTPLDDLKVLNKGLADRFRTLSVALEESFTFSRNSKTKAGDQVARRQKMAADWDHTVKEIRQLKEFENFLGVTPFAILQKAAVDGPVILVNISHYGSSAVIITAVGDPLSVPLPEATLSGIEALAETLIKITVGDLTTSKRNQNLTEILRELWEVIVAPVTLQLKSTLHLPVASRIWWMPTSVAWWLPLHAAGPYKRGKRNFSDLFISSYTPTLSSLIRSRTGYHPTVSVSGPRMLIVAQAAAEEEPKLENVGIEVDLIRQLKAQLMIIEGESCTRDKVLAHLKDTAWIHFSCHGHQHPTEPFKSHFSVGALDAPLTVLDIIRNGLPQAELAVLSACHSAAGEKTAPDEAINLAASMLFAGFRSVVGTMWAMDDRDGPVMTQEFYKYMFRNGPERVDCRDAAKALVMGVRALRQEVPLERWINFVHYGI
ncbi:hypothetical protein FRB95_009022 [Tulasnella sp. JGI-2019a]|nr:hypothetical protein FRB95_009022 [Tulasnella sp. JGI-2019a]